MSIIQCIRRLLNISNKCYEIPQVDDEPPEYEYPPPYYNEKHEKLPSKTDRNIINIITDIRNDKYNMGCLILDNNTPSAAKIIKYLFENYSTTNDMMVYMIKNYKHNHTISIGKNKVIKNYLDNHQKKIFIIGPKDLNIYITPFSLKNGTVI